MDAVIVTVMDVAAVRPYTSVTLAVMVCVPTERLFLPTLAPEPIAPSRLEVYVMLELMSPLVGMIAEPMNVMVVPC